MTDRLLIQGVPQSPLSDVINRLEIRDFIASEKHFSLYVQALTKFQNVGTEDKASYFQIAGIHGWPTDDWNGSPAPTDKDGKKQGFCTHGTQDFLPWHRPYVVLVEQEIQRLATGIAQTYTNEREQWIKAAAELRQPYWGWDKKETFVPPEEILRLANVKITLSDGTRTDVMNPFLTYKIPIGKKVVPDGEEISNATTTLRYVGKDGKSRPDSVEGALKALRGFALDSVKILMDFTDWSVFHNFLESLHNTMHNHTGGVGIGHMAFNEAAAFDPIFWLHHAQVDRLFQKWYLQHKGWSSSKEDLIPFWSEPNAYWKVPDIKIPPATFNYNYKDLIPTVPQADQSSKNEWRVHISCDKFEVGGSFTIYFFLGPVPSDPSQWLSDPAFAGVFDVFTPVSSNLCANCTHLRESGHSQEGLVYLTHAISKKLSDTTLEKDVVVPFLADKEKFNWALSKKFGESLDLSHLSSLETYVQLLSPFRFDGQPENLYEITRGRRGGYKGNA